MCPYVLWTYGYECVEAYAHMYMRMWRLDSTLNIVSPQVPATVFSSFWERMTNNDGAQVLRRLRKEEDGTKESFQALMKDLVILQETESFHSWNMNIFFLSIIYFLILFLCYFENCPGLSTRYLLRVRTQYHCISSCSCFF